MRRDRWKQGIGVFVCILALIAVPVGITWRGLYVEKLNHRLIFAVVYHPQVNMPISENTFQVRPPK